MNICFVPYELQGKPPFLNREGALLQFQFSDNEFGYADCHPWPELKDAPLKRQLSLLRKGNFTTLTRQSLIFARLDSMARATGKSIFDCLTIPQSHWLMLDWADPIPEGFSLVKLKVGRNPIEEIPGFLSLCKRLPETVKIRLDFNNRLSQKGVEEYLQAIHEGLEKIDFIEDPCPYENHSWESLQNQFGVRLACDHLSEKRLDDTKSHVVTVLKPAVQSEQLFRENGSKRLVVTSYLDHPLGQLAAAFIAGCLQTEFPGRIEPAGLLSHEVYQTNAFSDLLQAQQASLIPPEGTGFGFDDLLSHQDWKPLS